MLVILCDTAAAALLAAFALLFIGRFEVSDGVSIRRWVIIHAPRLVSEAFSCDFCLSWWTCLAICLAVWPFSGAAFWQASAVPVLATPITRFLIG